MTPTRYGDSGPKWGVVSESFGFMQDFEIKSVFEKATAEDHKGTTVAVEYYNKKWEGSFTIIDKGGATLPTLLATNGTTLSNAPSGSDGPSDGGVVIYEQDRKRENKGWQKRSYSFERWDGISSLSAVTDDGS